MNLFAHYHLRRGRHFLKKRMLTQALTHYSKLTLNDIPANEQVEYAMLYYETEQVEQALDLLNQIIDDDAHNDYGYERRAHILRELDKEEEALEDLDKAIRLNPNPYMYWYTRGLVHKDTGQLPEAIRDFKECIHREPEDTVLSTYYELGMCYYHNGDFAEASNVFRKILENRDKEIPIFYYRLAKTLQAQEQLKEAAACLESGIKVLDEFQAQPDRGKQWLFDRVQYGVGAFRNFQLEIQRSASFRLDLADIYESLGQYEAVQAACSSALALYPDRAELYVKRAAANRYLENWEQAGHDLDTAMELDKHYLEPYFEKALLYRAQEREEQALEVLLQLSGKKPEFPLVCYWVADSYCILEQYDDALDYNSRLLELEEDDALNYVQRAEIFKELGRMSEATAAYSKAIELNEHSQTRMKRSYMYYWQGQYDEAMIDLQKAVELDEELLNRSSYHNAMGHILEGMDQVQLANDAYTKAIELDPDIPVYYENRAKCFIETGELDRAVEDCLTGLNKDSSNGDLISLIGNIYYLKDDYEGALAYAKQYCTLFPEHVGGFFNLGVVHYKIGHKADALRAFDKTLELNPYAGRCYLYKAYIYYDQLDIHQCVDSVVNWNLFSFKEMTLEDRIRHIYELNGLDEDVLELAVKKIEDMFNKPSNNLN